MPICFDWWVGRGVGQLRTVQILLFIITLILCVVNQFCCCLLSYFISVFPWPFISLVDSSVSIIFSSLFSLSVSSILSFQRQQLEPQSMLFACHLLYAFISHLYNLCMLSSHVLYAFISCLDMSCMLSSHVVTYFVCFHLMSWHFFVCFHVMSWHLLSSPVCILVPYAPFSYLYINYSSFDGNSCLGCSTLHDTKGFFGTLHWNSIGLDTGDEMMDLVRAKGRIWRM